MAGSRLLLVSVKSRRDITWIREKKVVGAIFIFVSWKRRINENKKIGLRDARFWRILIVVAIPQFPPGGPTSNRFSARVVTRSHLVTMHELPNNHTLATSSLSRSPPDRHRFAIGSQSHCHRVVTTCNQTTLYIYICVYIYEI